MKPCEACGAPGNRLSPWRLYLCFRCERRAEGIDPDCRWTGGMLRALEAALQPGNALAPPTLHETLDRLQRERHTAPPCEACGSHSNVHQPSGLCLTCLNLVAARPRG